MNTPSIIEVNPGEQSGRLIHEFNLDLAPSTPEHLAGFDLPLSAADPHQSTISVKRAIERLGSQAQSSAASVYQQLRAQVSELTLSSFTETMGITAPTQASGAYNGFSYGTTTTGEAQSLRALRFRDVYRASLQHSPKTIQGIGELVTSTCLIAADALDITKADVSGLRKQAGQRHTEEISALHKVVNGAPLNRRLRADQRVGSLLRTAKPYSPRSFAKTRLENIALKSKHVLSSAELAESQRYAHESGEV